MPFVKSDTLTMHYAQWPQEGSEPVIFLHGNIGNWRWWQPVLERLPEPYRGYALDLRGCGLSDKPQQGHSVEQFAKDVLGFADALELSSFHLVGHSYGGLTALKVSLDVPERIKSLLLLDPIAAGGLSIGEEVMPAFVAWMNDRSALEEALAGTAPTVKKDFLWQQLVDEAFIASKGTFLDNARAMGQVNYSDRLADLKVSVHILWGEQDTWVAKESLMEMAAQLPNANLEVLEGVGHSLNVEAPEVFVRIATRFWQRVASMHPVGS